MNELKLETFIESRETYIKQIEAEEERSVAELEILFGELTEKLNLPGKNLDSHLKLLDLRDKVIVLLVSLVPSRELRDFFKKNLKRIAIQNL